MLASVLHLLLTFSLLSFPQSTVCHHSVFCTGLKYQHWIELVNGIPHINLDNLTGGSILEKNIHLSGRLNLSGSYVSLACFNGANFRSQNWGLFTLCEPTLSFTSHTNVYEKSCQVMRAISIHNALVMLGRADKKQNDVTNPAKTNMDFNVDGKKKTSDSFPNSWYIEKL